MESDEHGDFKVRLEMEENGKNLDFLHEIDEDFFMCDISKNAKCKQRYTAHCL